MIHHNTMLHAVLFGSGSTQNKIVDSNAGWDWGLGYKLYFVTDDLGPLDCSTGDYPALAKTTQDYPGLPRTSQD